jgi:hypothetical protein
VDPAGYLDPIGKRHHYIHHYQLDPGSSRFQYFHGFLTALRLEHPEAPFTQEPVSHAADGRLIVDNENTGTTPDVR